MPGTFNKTNRPKRPGAYFNWRAIEGVSVNSPLGGVVAVPIVHDWGPFEVPTKVTSFAEFVEVFGGSTDTAGYRAVFQAFKGEGVENRGGAAEVIVYRAGDSGAAKASRTIQNTTPVDAITLTARYEGTKGNDLKVQAIDNASDSNKTDLVVYDGTTEIERHSFDDTDIQAAVDSINNTSDWLTAALDQDGVVLTVDASPVALTGGDDGPDLVAQDWTDAREALETQRFAIIAPYDLTDSGILASFATWCTDLNAQGKRFMLVVGGAVGEDSATAITRSGTLDDPNIVNLGVGTYQDEDIVDANGAAVSLSTSQLAPRIAGIIAARGEALSVSFARLGGLSIVAAPTQDEILDGLEGGVLSIAQDSHRVSPVRLEKGITTYTSDTTDTPYDIYSQIKFVRTMHGIEMELTEFAEFNVVGRLPVNDATREYLVGEMQAQLNGRVDLSVIQPGAEAKIDIDPPPSDDQDFIQLAYTIKFGRSLEQVYNTVYVG